MILTISAIAIGLLIGVLTGGSLRRLSATPIRFAWLMLVGLVLPALVSQFDVPGGTFLILIALMAVAAFAATNLHLVGMGVVLVGLAMNVIPVAINGAMPVRADSLVAAGLVAAEDVGRAEVSGARRIEEPGDHFTFLGDIIPIRLTKQVLSFGDLVILFGVADIAANLVRRRRKRGDLPTGAEQALAAIAGDAETLDLTDRVQLSDDSSHPSITTAKAAHD